MIETNADTQFQFEVPREPLRLVKGFKMNDDTAKWAVPAAFFLSGGTSPLSGGTSPQHWTDDDLDAAAAMQWAEALLAARSGGACQVRTWVPAADGPDVYRPMGRYTTYVLTLWHTRADPGAQRGSGVRRVVYTSEAAAVRAVAEIRAGAATLELPRRHPELTEFVMLASVQEFSVEPEHISF